MKKVMGKTTELRSALKQRFFSLLEAKGFSCDTKDSPQFYTFRKILNDKICVLDIQFDKYGEPKFALNFSSGRADDIIPNDGNLSANTVCVYNFKNRGRLKSASQIRLSQAELSWFSQDLGIIEKLMGKKPKSADQVIDDLLNIFPEVEDFFEQGKIGKHLFVHQTQY